MAGSGGTERRLAPAPWRRATPLLAPSLGACPPGAHDLGVRDLALGRKVLAQATFVHILGQVLNAEAGGWRTLGLLLAGLLCRRWLLGLRRLGRRRRRWLGFGHAGATACTCTGTSTAIMLLQGAKAAPCIVRCCRRRLLGCLARLLGLGARLSHAEYSIKVL